MNITIMLQGEKGSILYERIENVMMIRQEPTCIDFYIQGSCISYEKDNILHYDCNMSK